MYYLISLLVAFGSIFLPSLIGALIAGENKKTPILMGFSVSLVYSSLLYWIHWSNVTGIYGPAPLFVSVLFGAIIGAIIGGTFSGSAKGAIPGIVVAAGYFIYTAIFVWIFNQSDMFHASEKAALLKVKASTEVSEMLEPTDPAFICLVADTTAKIKANAALSKFKVAGDVVPGSRYDIGEPTKQYVDGQLWWVFPLEFKGYFKWKQDKQVPGYLRVSAQDPYQDAQVVQYNKNGEEIHIKYLNSACYEYRADRYLRYNGFMGKILHDWTFEVDDNWNPYYTVSVVERTTGYSGYKTVGVVVLNLQSGEKKYYPNNEAPNWVDRIQPLYVVDYQTKKWGEYAHAGWWYNVWHNDKSQEPTPGWYLTYDTKGNCHWFSGFTSPNKKDQALTGIILVNSRTGEAVFYKTSGVTEQLSYKTAQSLWSNFRGYEPVEMVPYNIYGQLTYVIPTIFQGQFKGVSLVSLNNLDINSRGNTLEEALSNYRAMLAKAPGAAFAPAGGVLQTVTLDGRVSLAGQAMLQGQQQIFPFILVGVPKIFQTVYSYESPEAPFVAVGQNVRITYLETNEKVITCQTFDIKAITLSDQSPAQARYLEKKSEAKQEFDRVGTEERRDIILQSDRLKKADPKELEQFLKQQEQKK